ncbi:MAG TPA: UDP-3-O-acyl-N-acetylglucosamine deacetylase, partial [Candidatus Acidoferrales bacterium]|nr:UDP-3-O-acyl-N-acetylglucosamine deacetylase [Candidatus Acidoferrales bacterium]
MKEQTLRKTILVVDDEDGVRESVREVLSDEGYRVVDTGDGGRVMDLIKQEKPGLVLLDVWMPQIDGIGLLKEIKVREPELNVVMVSGHGNIHMAVTATKFGAFDFIEKPVSLDGLLLTVRRALGELSAAKTKRVSGQAAKRTGKTGKPLVAVPKAKQDALPVKQKTLKKSMVISGQGLHSGIKTGLILHPLPANSGILFSGISADVTIPAHLDFVGSTGYATTLRTK